MFYYFIVNNAFYIFILSRQMAFIHCNKMLLGGQLFKPLRLNLFRPPGIEPML